MARPLRLEFPGALYHVTSRGDHQEAIYRDDRDRQAWLDAVKLVCDRFNFVVHAYCQMTNHYHLLVETPEGNLAQGMRLLNSVFTQRFNRRHQLVGHLFQGRYKAILVQKESHLLELARYIVLNPLRAGRVATLDDWVWSSHFAMLGRISPPTWLATDYLLGRFGTDRVNALTAYTRFVAAGHNMASPLADTRHALVLGDDEFVTRHCALATPTTLLDVTKQQRRALSLSLSQYAAHYANPQEAMARAYLSTAYTMAQIGAHFSVSARTVSRALQKFV
jgi:putative transposase